ncbi:MAG: DMT family transporter, partial [Pseudomonadota bacterium]
MTKDKNAQGILFMVLSMAAFALADTLVKLSASTLSPAQVLFYLNGGGLVLFAALAVARNESLVHSRAFAPILLLRYFSEVAGMAGMVLALTYVPLSTVGAITQAAPILVVVGAVMFLGEKVSWRRWTSIAFGFFGVLLIVQPGTAGFDLTILWALLALVALSIRDLTTRLTPEGMPTDRPLLLSPLTRAGMAIRKCFGAAERNSGTRRGLRADRAHERCGNVLRP